MTFPRSPTSQLVFDVTAGPMFMSVSEGSDARLLQLTGDFPTPTTDLTGSLDVDTTESGLSKGVADTRVRFVFKRIALEELLIFNETRIILN